VGVDVTGRNIMPPDRRKDGPPWGHFVAGGTAGMVSKTLSSPLNVIAIRIATATVDAPLAGVLSVIPKAAAQVWAKDGLGGFWRGNFTNSLSSAPGKAIDFFSYALFKSLLTKVRKRVPSRVKRMTTDLRSYTQRRWWKASDQCHGEASASYLRVGSVRWTRWSCHTAYP
jgi:solute carrier family 25 phosphate transporter 23/24/25/41